MTEPLTLTKLILLYMLEQVDFPLKKSQLFDFILLDKEYTNYFTLMQAFNELIDAKLIETTSTHSTIYATITEEGINTSKLFSSKMSEGIKADIKNYFENHKIDIHNEVSTISNYYRTSNGDFAADLTVKEGASELINLKVYMPTEEAAESICNKWKDKAEDIYAHILENLL